MSLIDKLQSFSVKIQPFLDKFGAYKVHLCPEVKGRLTNNGEPLANVKIERGLYFSDGKARKDNTYTDSQGNFNFPCWEIRSDQPGIPLAEIRTGQMVKFAYEKREYLLWAATLHNINPIKEYSQKLKELNGEINNEEVFFKFDNKANPNILLSATSICRWDKDFRVIDPQLIVDEVNNLE
ncbi:MAG: DUF6795 domain-containing protein [Pseudoalteromonas prydzensis]|uniref:DUF6795 domain-containing protein n=1 Tax=Pseudoalteromonas prydzensis TaxID=182141 RepID=UPI003F9C28C9